MPWLRNRVRTGNRPRTILQRPCGLKTCLPGAFTILETDGSAAADVDGTSGWGGEEQGFVPDAVVEPRQLCLNRFVTSKEVVS